MLNIQEVSFAYGSQPVLADITLAIPTGQIWALVGRSGCGKTTLLLTVLGLFEPQRGRVLLNDGEPSKPGLIKGAVFQEESLLMWRSVIRNVTFTCPSRAPEAEVLLNSLGLQGQADRPPSELSAGMRKRVEFARAILTDDRYLVADEPFGTLDVLTRQDLWKVWREMRRLSPRTGLLTTHDPEEALRLCDAVVPLVGRDPCRAGPLIPVPLSVRNASLDDEPPELTTLKHEVKNALEA
jgi:ABC-type nitrate/sulfonate/bicarbonate transport system ATPase subunit